ncbi:MAG TPA: metallopeptidase TldD-related protein [Candidatus Binataceae bacterium]|nr:metallopeptidase TldD-related protein [Candidatus Binataceae bacterium]
MISLETLRQFARAAHAQLARTRDIGAFELYCSSADHLVARLNYTSDLPSRGLEECKSLNAAGFALRIVMRADPHQTGYAHVAGDFRSGALREALAAARAAVVRDPHFPGLPADPQPLAERRSDPAHDLLTASDQQVIDSAWAALSSAGTAFAKRTPLKLAHPGLIIGGDFSLIRDRVAIASSALPEVRTDENAYFSASVTALIEALDAKGTATAIGTSRSELERAQRLGRDAVLRALELRHGERPPAGDYRVVLGPQPIAEILNYMVMGSLTTGAFQTAGSAYTGRFGDTVMDARLTLSDDPLAAQGCVRRTITCEGLPARRTVLIDRGKLVGLLSNHYDLHRLLNDERRDEKLGPAAPAALNLQANSGYRLGDGAVRRFDGHPASVGTNVIMSATGGVSDRELIAAVRNGIYVGRVWYTYPINGQRAGDFTCTISGDSYVIRDGRLAAPLAPNCLRINAHIEQVFKAPLAVGRKSEPAIVWGAPEAYWVPALAITSLTLTSVNPA